MKEIIVKNNATGLHIFINSVPNLKLIPKDEAHIVIAALELQIAKFYETALGKHRLMCGDNTKRENVARFMNVKTARFVFNDPPWNVDYSDTAHSQLETVDTQMDI